MKKKKKCYICIWYVHRCECVCVDRETERDRMVLIRMSSCVPHFSHPTVECQAICLLRKSSNISQKALDLLWVLWGQVSLSDLVLLQIVLASKVHNLPQTPRSQSNCRDFLCCTCY